MKRIASVFASFLTLACLGPAQVPAGWYIYGAFGPQRGRIGVFMSHPRTVGMPDAIEGLQGDLAVTGSSCILYRATDGALIVGERSPTDSSVDVHAIYLRGTSVLLDASFSVGTGGPCCGEIPQMGLLADGRVVVVATDLSAGALKNYQTTSYGWQGVGIVDTRSGSVTPIHISNGAQILDVFNGMAVAPDERFVYLGTYVSGSRGDIWEVPLAGGTATRVASVPAGLSNLAFAGNGELWVTTLDPSQALFRVDVATATVVQVPQTNGSLNAIAYEAATGNLALLSANAGMPARSVFWMEPNGTGHLLSNPGYATLSGIAVVPNPAVFGRGTPGSASYSWQMPNPGGLPLAGNSNFSITVVADGSARPGWAAIATARAATPINVLGADLYFDPRTMVLAAPLPFPGPMTLSMPIPASSRLVGASLVVQSLHLDFPPQLATSPGLEIQVL